MILGFSNILRNSTPYYFVDLPSFQRDFASLKTLDHGTGPAITFTRASGATYFDADGTLQTAGNNVPRFDHDPATGASRGLLIEEARTNSIRNSQGGGSTNGVIGSGGVLPTNWGQSGATLNAIAIEIIGTGTEDGLAYVDVKFSGTPTATSSVFVTFDGATQIVAANGQAWTGSSYSKLVGGNLTNVTQTRAFTTGRDATGVPVSGQFQSTNFTPDSTALKLQRRTAAFTFTDATVGRVQNGLAFSYTSGDPIDITLRIAAPQLELGAFPTSYIPTTTAAATRSADNAVVTPIASFYNQAEGTLFAEFQAQTLTLHAGTSSRRIVQFDNSGGSPFQQIFISQNSTNDSAQSVGNSGSTQWNIIGGSSITSVTKAIVGFIVDNVQAAFNGTLGTADTSAAIPSVDMFRIGRGRAGGTFQGHIRKIAYYPKRLTNTLLEQLTT